MNEQTAIVVLVVAAVMIIIACVGIAYTAIKIRRVQARDHNARRVAHDAATAWRSANVMFDVINSILDEHAQDPAQATSMIRRVIHDYQHSADDDTPDMPGTPATDR